MSEQSPFKPTPEEADTLIEANEERWDASIGHTDYAISTVTPFHRFDELDRHAQS